jgi:hypothetical protein
MLDSKGTIKVSGDCAATTAAGSNEEIIRKRIKNEGLAESGREKR